MIYFGDFDEDATVYLPWNSADSSGASITRATDGSIRIYKNNGTTEKATANGITDSEDFDSVTGVHMLTIDTSVDTGDSGFWEAGNDYHVVLVGATIDGQTVNHAIGTFSIENRFMRGTDSVSPPSAASIADAVLDEALSGHTTAGTLGKAVADIETDATAILADTDELQGDDVPGLIAALNDISSADVNAACDAALSDYDGPTKAELDSGLAGLNDPTAAAIADAVWDEAQSGHTSAGSFGEIATEIAAILADTNELQGDDVPGLIAALNDVSSADVNAACDTAIADASLATAAALAAVDTVVDAILLDTAEIGAAGAGLTEAGGTGDHLTAIPWNASWDAEVQSECADALTAYDPPTKAELDSGLAALNDLAASDILTTALTESYAADATEPTLSQFLYMIWSTLHDFAIVGTTLTSRQLDGSAAMTHTLDSASSPTSRTRAT